MIPALPLPASELPEAIRRFGDPNAPAPARTMAARGLVPVKGSDLVTLVTQLTKDADETVAAAAKKTLAGLPDAVLLAACAAPLHAAILDGLADAFERRDDVVERLVLNVATADMTVERLAKHCSESISEAIAVNQQRILRAPKIIEALYVNPKTRMSTADRLVELCARNGVVLDGIPSFADHVEAIQGELIMEPTAEPLPDDLLFADAVSHDADADAIEVDEAKEKEGVKEEFLPLRARIDRMTKQQKIRFAILGSAAARSILVRDPNKAVARAAISSPRMTVAEAAAIATSKEVTEEILRYIGNKKKWVGNYEVKRSLMFNPKTPIGISMKFLTHLRDNDLKTLTRSRNVSGPLKQAAQQRIDQKTKKRG